VPHAIPTPNHYYHPSFLTPSSLPHNISSSPFERGGGGGFLVGSGPGYSSPPQFATSPPTFGGSPSSPGSVLHIRTAGGASGDLNSPTYLRSPNSSGGFGDGFGSGWGSGPRKPLTNPFKESFDLSPFPSTTIDPKEKESAGSSGDDSFELLESESSTSKSTHTTPEERRIVDALELMVRKTAVVTELADGKVDESPIDALALYIKALHIYHSISQFAKKNAQSQNLTASKRLGLVVERMRSEFKATLKKAEYLKRNLKPNDSCPPAEKSIYESALQMGRDGAVAEVLHNFSKAESLYVRSSQLLQLLTMDASHPSDKAVLESYIASFEKRLGEVRKNQAKLDDHVEDSLNVASD